MKESKRAPLVVIGIFLVTFPTLCAFTTSDLFGTGVWLLFTPLILFGSWVIWAALFTPKKFVPHGSIDGAANSSLNTHHSTNDRRGAQR
jgi:hypothetical protein